MHIKTKPGSAYHLWDGKDTACRMYSTKGIKRRKVNAAKSEVPA